MSYARELSGGWFFDLNYGISYVGDMLNSVGAGQFADVLPYRGEVIPSYTLHSMSVKLSAERWSASLFIDNLFDQYYYTSTLGSQRYLEQYRNFLLAPGNSEAFLLRTYGRFIGRPRTVGLSFSFDF